jgi:Rieske Fe-S protein
MLPDIPPGSVLPFRSGKFYLVRLDDGGFIALSLKCSHLGCSVIWNKEEGKFICPCHSSQFDIRGNVLSRPAPRALDYYPVIISEGEIKVDISQPIRRRVFDKSQATYA